MTRFCAIVFLSVALWYCAFAEDKKCNSVSDEWRQVGELDNSGSTQTNQYQASTTTGIDQAHQNSQGGNQDKTMTVELGGDAGINFFEIFKVGMSGKGSEAQTQGHNWQTTDSQTLKKSETVTRTFNVPGGKKLKVMQLVGKCDNIEFKTNVLKPIEEGEDVSQGPPQKSHGGKRRRRDIATTGSSISECRHANNYCYADKECCSKICQVPVVGQHGVCI